MPVSCCDVGEDLAGHRRRLAGPPSVEGARQKLKGVCTIARAPEGLREAASGLQVACNVVTVVGSAGKVGNTDRTLSKSPVIAADKGKRGSVRLGTADHEIFKGIGKLKGVHGGHLGEGGKAKQAKQGKDAEDGEQKRHAIHIAGWRWRVKGFREESF